MANGAYQETKQSIASMQHCSNSQTRENFSRKSHYDGDPVRSWSAPWMGGFTYRIWLSAFLELIQRNIAHGNSYRSCSTDGELDF